METNLLLAIFVLLAVTVALVPLAKAAGFGTILGYLAAGVLIGPYGLGLVRDTETIRHISEFGVVLMLFLIGLELQPRELWRMRNKVAGLGLTQYAGTAAIIGTGAWALGMNWQTATIVGLALSMSSTAIALQSIATRGIMTTDTGRGSLAILLVQDVAVIPVLAAIPLLATGAFGAAADAEHAVAADWLTALQIIGAFAFTIIAGRTLVRPLMRFVAVTGVREGFFALGLTIVVGTALLMQSLGLSPALGAFLGGVLLADSEYRHELESTLAPFQGLLLGLFFISVGTSMAFSVLAAQPVTIIGMVLGLVAIKALVLFALTGIFRMHLGDRILLAFMLSQIGEFAFVILQFARSTGGIGGTTLEMLTMVVALSMAVTPILLFVFDKFVAPRLHRGETERAPDNIDARNKVIVLGYGRFGQIVTRLLSAQGFEMTLIDDDPAQIELVKRYGAKVFYGDGRDIELLHAAGAADAELIVVAVAGSERILEIAKLVRRHFPHVKVAARAIDRSHAHDLMDADIGIWERETFRGALSLGTKALVALGYSQSRATRLANAFEKHDMRILEESRALRGDDEAYVGFLRRSTELLDEVLRADRGEQPDNDGAPQKQAEAAESDAVDNDALSRSE